MSFFDISQNFSIQFTLSLPHEKIKRHETKDKPIRGDFRGEPLSAKFTLQAPRVNPIVSIYIFTTRYKYSNILYMR